MKMLALDRKFERCVEIFKEPETLAEFRSLNQKLSMGVVQDLMAEPCLSIFKHVNDFIIRGDVAFPTLQHTHASLLSNALPSLTVRVPFSVSEVTCPIAVHIYIF